MTTWRDCQRGRGRILNILMERRSSTACVQTLTLQRCFPPRESAPATGNQQVLVEGRAAASAVVITPSNTINTIRRDSLLRKLKLSSWCF